MLCARRVLAVRACRAAGCTQSSHAAKRQVGLEGFIAKCPLFDKLSTFQLSRIASALHPREYQAGEAIVKEGQEGSHFYVVEEGAVRVTVTNQAGSQQEVAMLKPGDFFGEHALLTHDPRNATCTAVANTVCLALGRVDFEKLLGNKLIHLIKVRGKHRPPARPLLCMWPLRCGVGALASWLGPAAGQGGCRDAQESRRRCLPGSRSLRHALCRM